MSIAYQDIENQLDHGVTPVGAPAPAQLLIVARTEHFGAAIFAQMAGDAGVKGRVLHAALAEAMRDAHNLVADFIVFEGDPEDAFELDAVRDLSGQGLQLVAMLPAGVTAAQEAAYLAAGACEVLCSEEDAPEVEATAPVAPIVAEPVAAAPTLAAPAISAQLVAAPVPEVVSNPQVEQGAVTLVLRARGGAGATTVAVNLAIAQARRCGGAAGGRVALVDLDIQNGTVASLLDLPDSTEFSQLLMAGGPLPAGFVGRAMQRHSSGVDVLAAPDVFAPMGVLTPELVADLINGLRGRYEHVILDLPQAVMEWLVPVLDQAARLIVVTDTSVPSIKQCKRLINVVTEDHMTLPVTVVVNGQRRPFMISPAVKEAASFLGHPLDHWIAPEAALMRKARDMGVPLIVGAKRSGASRAIVALSEAVMTPKSSPKMPPKSKEKAHV